MCHSRESGNPGSFAPAPLCHSCASRNPGSFVPASLVSFLLQCVLPAKAGMTYKGELDSHFRGSAAEEAATRGKGLLAGELLALFATHFPPFGEQPFALPLGHPRNHSSKSPFFTTELTLRRQNRLAKNVSPAKGLKKTFCPSPGGKLGNFLSPCLIAPGGDYTNKVMLCSLSFSWAFRPPPWPVSLAPERAEPPRARKEGIIQRFRE